MTEQCSIIVNSAWCKSCGICVEICPKNVLFLERTVGIRIVNPDSCIGCKMCEIHCPDFALVIGGDK